MLADSGSAEQTEAIMDAIPAGMLTQVYNSLPDDLKTALKDAYETALDGARTA
jgi:TRAP-type C4-dicarboxylate transport system substrate-binding protein